MPTGASFEELNAFIATAQAGSFTAAARRIGRDASAVSRRVGQLEQRLGVRLLLRTTRAVSLTEAGDLFLARAQAALEELDAAAREVTNLGTDPQGRLRISLPVSYGREIIAPLLPTFMSRYPSIVLDLDFADRIVDLVAERYDLVIRAGVVRDSSLISRKIDTFSIILVASPAYVGRYGPPETPADLDDHVCLGFTRHLTWPNWVFTKGDQTSSVRPKGPMVANNPDPLILAARHGVGIGLIADFLVASHLACGALVRLLPEWEYASAAAIHAIMPPGRLAAGKTRVFVDEIAQALSRRASRR